MENDIGQILERFPKAGPDALIPILQEVQQEYGHIPDGCIALISNHINMATSRIFGVATFYDQFRFEAKGKHHIRICSGTTCHLEGSSYVVRELEKILRIKPGQVSRDGTFSIEQVQCLGSCGKSPVMEVGGRYWEGVSPDMIKDIIQELKSGR